MPEKNRELHSDIKMHHKESKKRKEEHRGERERCREKRESEERGDREVRRQVENREER